ncbi:uncharacterized protein [Gossypium hirsutum]|uniref:Uncharacterized protein n=1 Tax=Gossypium hirsutum TaxID=3635 RepID=A0ABM3ASV3_GOSHI|nr:uncharacterized protein LOC121222106 [Gossypium hirsutum]
MSRNLSVSGHLSSEVTSSAVHGVEDSDTGVDGGFRRSRWCQWQVVAEACEAATRVSFSFWLKISLGFWARVFVLGLEFWVQVWVGLGGYWVGIGFGCLGFESRVKIGLVDWI